MAVECTKLDLAVRTAQGKIPKGLKNLPDQSKVTMTVKDDSLSGTSCITHFALWDLIPHLLTQV